MTHQPIALRALVAAILMALSFAVPALPAEAAGTYRVLTYNVQGLPQLVTGVEYDYGKSHSTRGRQIGARAAKAGYDIMAFNEVFADTMRSALASKFPSSQFPTRVLEFDTASGYQDSGLMLVSRFKSLPLTVPTKNECVKPAGAPPVSFGDGGYCAQTAKQECIVKSGDGCIAAFHSYEHCASTDCMANKGVGLVRLANPFTGRPIDVLLSHMNAAYKGKYTAPARRQQFAEIRAFIDRWSPKAAAAGRDTLFMGDLNVIAGSPEWASELGTDSPLDNDYGFRDLWAYENLPTDPALITDPGYTVDMRNVRQPDPTGTGDHEKLDYILLRRSDQPSCVNHQRNPRTLFRDSTRADLSDHLPLEATISTVLGGNCAPYRAQSITGESTVTQTPTTAGGSLWYRIDTAGTWTLQDTTPGTSMHVFDKLDISTPIGTPPAADRTYFVVKPGQPVFVRVFPDDRSAQPAITTTFHLATGEQNDPVHLVPNSDYLERVFFGTNLLAPSSTDGQTRYFHLLSPATTSGRESTVTLTASETGGADLGELKLELLSSTGQVLRTAPVGKTTTLKVKLSSKGGTYGVRLHAAGSGYGRISYASNVRAVRLLRLRCDTQEDETGDDKINLFLSTDKRVGRRLGLGKFDGDQAKSLETRYGTAGVVTFIERIRAHVEEVDSDSDDDDLGSDAIKASDSSSIVRRMHFTQDDADYSLYYLDVPLP